MENLALGHPGPLHLEFRRDSTRADISARSAPLSQYLDHAITRRGLKDPDLAKRMAKKAKAKSRLKAASAPRHKKAGKLRRSKRPVKKPKAKRPIKPSKAGTHSRRRKANAQLHAKGGGNATAAGVGFQASVGAVFATQMLTESLADARADLPAFKVKSVRFESDAPLDDVVVKTDHDGWLFIQAKTTLDLSLTAKSEFLKTAAQIVRQWHAGQTGDGSRAWNRPLDAERDRLIIAVGPTTSQSISTDLAKALTSMRAQSSAPLPVKCRDALNKLTRALKQSWKAVTGKAVTAADIKTILRLIAVIRFDMDGPDRTAAIAQMRLIASQAARAHSAFAAVENVCQGLMQRRQGADGTTLRRLISQAGVSLHAAPSFQQDVATLRNYSKKIADELAVFETTVLDGSAVTVERAATKAVIDAAKRGSLLVIGEPGSGKSAVVSAAAGALRAANANVVQFAVDRLPVDTADALRSEIGLTHRLPEILENWPGTKSGFLFIDALDATRGGRGEAVFRTLIKDVMALPGNRWRVVASIRSFDLKLGEQFRELFIGSPPNDAFKDIAFSTVKHISIPVWSEDEFAQLLSQAKSLATAIAQGGQKLRDLAAVPFNTRLLADLLAAGLSASEFGGVRSQVELLAIYWGHRVAPLGTAAELCLRAAIELMVTTHTLQAEKLAVAKEGPEALDKLFKANVLVPVIGDRYVGFRHHILFDYAASRLFIDPVSIGAMTARLLTQPGLALMLAPALAYALHDLWLNSKVGRPEFWLTITELTGVNPSDPVARSVAARMASELPADAGDVAGLANLLGSARDSQKAARAFTQVIGALTVRVEDGLVPSFEPWCQLADDAAAYVELVAWPLRTLLFQIVGKVTEDKEKAQLGNAARALLTFALSDTRGSMLVQIGIDLVCDTYETDPQASRALLSQVMGGQRFAEHAHEDMPSLARKANIIFEHDPDFVVEIYRTVFGHRVADTSATRMGNSQILAMTSNKKQDYDHSRWQLAQYVPSMLERNARMGVRCLVAAIEGIVATEHSSDSKENSISIAGQSVHLLDDLSHIWAHDPEDRHAHSDNGASMIGAFLKRLTDAPDAEALELARLMIAENRLAVLWSRLFLATSRRPDVLGDLMWPIASSLPFLQSVDTRKDAIDAVAATYPRMKADERRSFEERIEEVDFSKFENPDRAKQRLLATVFRAIGENNLETDKAKELLAQAVANSVPQGNNRGYSTFMEWGQPEPYYWLRDKGVDVESPANSSLLQLADAVPGRAAPDGSQPVTVTDAIRALEAVAASLLAPPAPPPSPIVTEHAQTSLLQGCVALAHRRADLAADATAVRALIALIEPHLATAPTASSDEHSGKLRALAAEAAMLLCAVSLEAADALVPKIEPLLTDPLESVRSAIADDVGCLWAFAREPMWRFADYFGTQEASFPVLQRFTGFLVRLVHNAPGKTEELAMALLPRVRTEPKGNGDRIIHGIGNVIAILWLRYQLPGSRAMLDSWLTDLAAHKSELNRAAYCLRDTVILGYGTGNPDDTALRRRAQMLAKEIADASSLIVTRYVGLPATSRTEKDDKEVQAAVRLLDNVGDQLYFSSGTFRSNPQEPPSGLVTAESKKAFLDEMEDTLYRLGDAGTPHTIYYLIDLLGALRSADPARVFDLVAHALLDAGRMHGFQFESLGADRFVEVIGVFLADHREIFNDQARREKLIACLDAFVEAGWPKARRLLYRLPELL